MKLSALFYLKGRQEEDPESVELPGSPFRSVENPASNSSQPSANQQSPPNQHTNHQLLHPHAHSHGHGHGHGHGLHHLPLDGSSPPALSPFLAQELNFGEFDVKEFLANLETAFGNEMDFLNMGDWQ